MSAIRIRTARREDLEAVRRVLAETWHDTYDALIGAERVAEIVGRWHAIDVLAAQLQEDGTASLVAEAGGKTVGHAFANGRRPPLLQLARLYVLPTHQRRGVGTKLLDAALERWPNLTTVSVNVEAGNDKGVNFYRKHGFRVVREAMEEGLRTFRMERAMGVG